ncbi:leucine-rich repeat flightless-interacting protein 1 isoform X24 [Apus apus]|uniref:leucine-rich repeat flightless-interacting protein 1 isoform X24 n=1 Tax=Apus apus TaxID=8895 RepID=UPI0021F8287C|nr:leucine-rich repeat flightless-interacting protein 1 isoform X24 [Apus apus]
MGSQGAGRKRLPTRERLTAEDDALNQIAREAEARLAAKRAARAEAREIRMKELERQQKEIYQVQKKYYGLDSKWGDIEQWMEDSERCSRRARRNPSASDEDELVSLGSRGSLRPPEYSSFLASGSRASSRASSARASPVIEERPEKDFEKGARCVSSLSAATLASLGGTSSRRGSGDTSISADTEASIREIKDLYELKDQIQDVEGKYMQGLKEMKDSLAEVEEKYKKAMVSNAQLDNDKTNFMYQVDTLKDALLELEEQLAESRRQYQEKSKELEREKHAHSILHFQFLEIKEALKQREEMLAEIQQLQQTHQSHVREIADLQETIEWKDKKIGALERQRDSLESVRSERDDLRDEVVVLKEQLKKHGIIPSSAIATNGETPASLENEGHLDPSRNVPLKPGGDGILDRLKRLGEERESLLDQIRKLKRQLEEKQRNGKLEGPQPEEEVLENGTDVHMIDLQTAGWVPCSVDI